MVAVFRGFAAGDLVMFQQMGFGLAVAVLIDATIVRSVFVPATVLPTGQVELVLPTSAGVGAERQHRGTEADDAPRLGSTR